MTRRDGDASVLPGKEAFAVAVGLMVEEAETYALLSAVIAGHAAVCPLCGYTAGRRPPAAGPGLLPGGAGREGDTAPVGAEPIPTGSISPVHGCFPPDVPGSGALLAAPGPAPADVRMGGGPATPPGGTSPEPWKARGPRQNAGRAPVATDDAALAGGWS